RFRRWGRMESFLLAKPPAGTCNLAEWLRDPAKAVDWRRRLQVLRETAFVLRRMHEAGCFFAGGCSMPEQIPLAVQELSGHSMSVVVNDISRLRTCRQSRRPAERDLRLMRASLPSRIDQRCFFRHYLRADANVRSPSQRAKTTGQLKRALSETEVA